MIPMDLEERLKRIVEGGAVPPTAEDVGLALGEGFTESSGEDLPKGTKVVFAEPDLEVSAPVRKPIVPRAPDATPAEKVVQVPSGPEQDPDRLAAAYARAQDRTARSKMAFERGGRELVAGLTRTQAQPVTERPTDAFERYVQGQRAKKNDELRAAEVGNNAARTNAYLASTAAAGPRTDRKLSLDEQEAAARAERAKAKAEQDAAELEERKRHNEQTEGIGRTNANKPSGSAVTERRQTMREDALKPRAGWEPIVAGDPVFRSPQDASKFDGAVAAMGAIRNHRDHVLHEVEALKKAKSPQEADQIAGRLNAQMGALASKLRDAEGLNNTDASNQAVEHMLSLSNGSAINWKNVLNQGRLPSILNAAIASGEANLDTLAASQNLRRGKGGAAPQKHEESAGNTTPSGKPYARKQYSASKNQTRFLDPSGAVVEVVDGR